jgi:ribosomal-protein-alanine N-acetyltransferase
MIPSVIGGSTQDVEIYNIGVRPIHQHEGIGSELMRFFLKECQKRSVAEVWLEVRRGNSTALAFYSKHRFEVVAVRKAFYRDPIEDAIVMRSKLYKSLQTEA